MTQAAKILIQLTDLGVRVRRLCADSRRVEQGDVFVAYPGAHADGRRFMVDAVARGAAAVLCEPAGAEPLPVLGVPVLPVPQLAAQVGHLAHLVYGRPSEQLWLAGVTGTNGKTSVSHFIAQALAELGRPCALIGTLGNGFPGALVSSPNTTPDAITLHQALADYRDQGARACAMEVSSIGLDQGRVAGAHFAVAVFTNLTRDHLEYHGSMDAYAQAKARLFELPGLRAAVLNLDDALGRQLAQDLRGRLRTIGYTLEQGSGGTDELLGATDLELHSGLDFRVNGLPARAALVGRFNVANLLAVLGALRAADIPLDEALAVLPRLRPPAGRMESQGGGRHPLVVVDYAHSPDALEQALMTLKETARERGGRLICLFGCGGERDPGKRPLMGAVAERLADRVVLTSDNPRSESPEAIIAAICTGMAATPEIELDRRRAVRRIVAESAATDVILVAGKGHEPYQEIAGVRQPYSDAEQVRLALETRS
ncbi:UDP-N-acetylmuramoyl-L-alanyl-D-glutamate--2,6-diaminopimelate ligase [Denitratisoma oestradiolicum]|uniref:UDP-N-acetylmuramoyl-L-alanyl-D-glutamate--2,6-diaminopimelate ligase n=1 Tax=Denitratisoma oestradiolicum TaxID=311182 RepID=A0A6S6XW22_9PROT|nr:UDP-N-acetylmuramoyl-L-alanyl-D-glutamate--2,6-diaminopimelate ligase [Denitratisoma oestradiolicum]TWO80432.1 UDP-N-acetylmuramoyl-L-alanyl-D-glutamate--2,6-diaminopimelate ligase [Denitratisoma oestradiolicum]CAB1370244.1 UDP-N-acetylmuramoyl-L-alanyl-D-glutamate:meso-diaminopimelate ligase [Denitratisoma oestradiolicum]